MAKRKAKITKNGSTTTMKYRNGTTVKITVVKSKRRLNDLFPEEKKYTNCRRKDSRSQEFDVECWLQNNHAEYQFLHQKDFELMRKQGELPDKKTMIKLIEQRYEISSRMLDIIFEYEKKFNT
jgi:hypothetical protein